MKQRERWEGHRERLRDRAVAGGLDALREPQIIELLLCYAVPRVDVSEVAMALYQRMGSVSRVLKAPREALLAVPGVTPVMAEWLMLTGELVDAYLDVEPERDFHIWRFYDVSRLLAAIWQSVPAPQTWMLYTDFEGRLLLQSVICESLAWADAQCAARMVEEALSTQARRALLVLFTGVQPQALTDWEGDYLLAFSRTLRAIGVELLDCVLVGEPGMLSLSKAGLMEAVAAESQALALHEDYRRDEEAM